MSCSRVAILLLAVFVPQVSLAAIRTVTNVNDSGAGSLRQAILDAESSDTIVPDASIRYRTITLTSASLEISKSLTIDGTGSGLVVSGGKSLRVFDVLGAHNVVMRGITIRDGRAGESEDGGGLRSSSTLLLEDVTVTENQSPTGGGGGISNEGTLTLNRCTVSYNLSTGYRGGGILKAATLHVVNSTIRTAPSPERRTTT
jgi:hypothetical protein